MKDLIISGETLEQIGMQPSQFLIEMANYLRDSGKLSREEAGLLAKVNDLEKGKTYFQNYLEIIDAKKKEIIEKCEIFHVQNLYVFGSVLTDNFDGLSDIDFLVNFQNIDLLEYAENYFSFKQELSDLFARNIDLVVEKDLQNEILIQSINRSKLLIYERKNTEVVA